LPLVARLSLAAAILAAATALAASHAGAADLLDTLVAAYPEALAGHDARGVIWRDGTAMTASDGRADKPFAQLLTEASILDQFRLPYRRGPLARPPSVDEDPGRFRNEPFFTKMYGDCRAGGLRKLAPVVWLPQSWGKTIWVTSVNGVAEKLTAVSAEIDALPAEVKRAAYPIAGVLNCRAVRDTGRLSMHAYAAAIDLNTAFADYWLWQKPGSGPIPYRNRMPPAIVAAFEKHGFIWGGKWYHYDTMHFEYRPELLAEKLLADPQDR
jgi:D-alanyl-D-alanine carboxypeptidase-like protein